ncbi:MAG: hypothetical protein ACI9UO_002550 [Nitrospinales bacterium]
MTFDFKPFKNPEIKIRRKDIKRGMLALLATPVKKIIVSKENNIFNKQKYPNPSFSKTNK